MKFEKFGAFPHTKFEKTTENNFSSILPTLVNLLGGLKKKENHDNQVAITEKTSKEKLKPSPNAIAYSEYVAKHNAHVSKSHEISEK